MMIVNRFVLSSKIAHLFVDSEAISPLTTLMLMKMEILFHKTVK